MGKATLVEADMEAGKALLKRLDEVKFKVKAALWLYMPDPEEWRLVLASPSIDTDGPKKAYEKVQSELQESDGRSELSLQNISLVSPHDKLIKALKTTIKTGKEMSHIRLTRNVINGLFIEDAYIYRLT